MAAYRALWRKLGHARWFAFTVRYALAGIDRRIYRASNGRMSVTGPPVFDSLLLTTTGRKSGRPRTTPLIYVVDGERLVVTTENFGMRDRPAAWRLNVEADPDVVVQVGADVRRCRARRAGDDEVARFWPRFLEQWPAFDSYHRRSGERHMFVLEPAG